MAIKEDCNEYIIFTDRNVSTLELYNGDVNTHDVTAGVDNNHNNYNKLTQHMKTVPITNNTEQPMKMATVLTQPMNTATNIPTILQLIKNKRWWIVTLYKKYREWEPLKKNQYWTR